MNQFDTIFFVTKEVEYKVILSSSATHLGRPAPGHGPAQPMTVLYTMLWLPDQIGLLGVFIGMLAGRPTSLPLLPHPSVHLLPAVLLPIVHRLGVLRNVLGACVLDHHLDVCPDTWCLWLELLWARPHCTSSHSALSHRLQVHSALYCTPATVQLLYTELHTMEIVLPPPQYPQPGS